MKAFGMIVAAVMTAGVVMAGEVKWEKNYDDGLAQAKKESKLVMVDVYTDWCGWCKKLDKDVYTQKEVGDKLAKDFVAIKLNPEKSAKNKKIVSGFGVQGFPTILFLNADGKEIGRIGGYVPADKFVKQLDEISKKK